MEKFKEFVDFVEKGIELDGWALEKGLHPFCEFTLDEAKELVEASETKDYHSIKNEVGDILSNIVHICKLAEKEGHFTVEDVVEHAMDKLSRRRPYVAEGRKVSAEEADKLWEEEKERETTN